MTMRPLILLALLLTACVPTAPNELVALGNVRNTATAEAVSTQAAALPITESANERQFSQDQTATYSAPALRDTEQAQALIDATLTAVWIDATTTAAIRATEAVEFAVICDIIKASRVNGRFVFRLQISAVARERPLALDKPFGERVRQRIFVLGDMQ